MQANTKKIILITIASIAGALLLAALGWLLYFNSQFASYQDGVYRFSMKYPIAWKMVRAPQDTVAVVFVSPKENALDIIQENVNVTVQFVPDDMASLKTFSDKITQQMTAVFKKSINIVENQSVNIGNRQGQRMIFEAPKPDNLKVMVTWTIKNGQAYIITFLGTITSYPQYKPLLDEMIKSFHLN